MVNQFEWREWDEYEKYIFGDEGIGNNYSGYGDTPSKEGCDKLCREFSGEVIVYKMGGK